MTHTDIWRAIDKMASEQKMTCSAMARRGGLCATAFNKSKRETKEGKPRWVSMQSIAKVLNSTGQPMGYFAAIVDNIVAARERDRNN